MRRELKDVPSWVVIGKEIDSYNLRRKVFPYEEGIKDDFLRLSFLAGLVAKFFPMRRELKEPSAATRGLRRKFFPMRRELKDIGNAEGHMVAKFSLMRRELKD